MSFYKGKNVAVTGGAGFAGSHLVDHLVKLGANVLVIDGLCRGKMKNLSQVISDIGFLETDLSKYSLCLDAFKNQEIVFNCAAKVTGIEYNRFNHTDMFESNIKLQINPLKAAANCGVERFLQVSTVCIYPHDKIVPTPESEGDRGQPEPTNAGYGWAKRMGEKYARWIDKESKMDVAIIRPSNMAGLRDHYDEGTSHVIPAIIKRVLDGEDPVTCWGSGNQTRSFLNPKDFAVGACKVLEKYPVASPINVGSDEEISMLDLTKLILKKAGKTASIHLDTSKPDGYPRRAADLTKLKKVTGWTPTIKVEETVKEMIDEYNQR